MKPGHRKVLDLVREDDFQHDPWGACMMWHFAICEVLVEWAPPYPPAEWGFHMGLGGPDQDSHMYQTLTEMMESGEVDEWDLLHAGTVLHRYEQILDKAGKSY